MLEICIILIIFLALYLYFFGLLDVYRFWKPLWRILRPDEDPKVGLVAKDPQACKTVISHVNCGGNEYLHHAPRLKKETLYSQSQTRSLISMRDGRFASWENIVSRFQTSPP